MSINVAGAILLLASAQMGAPVEPINAGEHQYSKESFMSGAGGKALYLLASGVAAAGAYRMSDETLEYYPLQANFRAGGRSLGDTLSMHRGGMRFSFSAVRPANVKTFSEMPDYREEARNMAKAMPGYPQPARIVIGVRVSY